MRPSTASAAGALLLSFLLGCEKEGAETFDGATEEQPPKQLLAVAEIPSATDTAVVADFLGTVSPEARAVASGIPLGLGAMMTDYLETSDVVDLDGPVRILIVDPDLSDPPVAFIARAKRSIAPGDGGAIRSLGGGLYLFGGEAAVSELLPHAAHLARTPPQRWSATLYPAHLVARFGADLETMMAGVETGMPDMQKVFDLYGRMLRTFAEDTEVVTLHIAGAASDSHLVIDAHARPGSAVATFYAAQEPWKRRTLELLPAFDAPTMVGVGTLHAGPALGALQEYMEIFLAGEKSSSASAELFAEFSEVWSGEMAMAMRMKMDAGAAVPGFAMEMVSVAPVASGAKSIIDRMFSHFAGTREIMGMTQTLEYDASSRQYDGVELARYRSVTTAPGATEPFFNQEQISEVAVTDGKVILGSAGADLVPRAIDRVRGHGRGMTLSPALEQAIAASLKARESFLFYMDMMSAVPSAPASLPVMVLSVGFTDAHMTMRFRFL